MKLLKFALVATALLCLMSLISVFKPVPQLLESTAHAQSTSISGLQNEPSPQSNYLFVIAIPGVANRNISWGQITNLLGLSVVNNVTYFTNVSILNTFNVSGKATMSIVNMLAATSTNGFYVMTNLWSGGPTGTVDLALTDQGLASATACSLTGVINKSNTVVESVVLSLTNTSATNWLLTLAAGIRIPQRTNQVALSNGSMATLSLRYHPAFGTNGVWVHF